MKRILDFKRYLNFDISKFYYEDVIMYEEMIEQEIIEKKRKSEQQQKQNMIDQQNKNIIHRLRVEDNLIRKSM